jgi:dipeptidyl-peptidase-4
VLASQQQAAALRSLAASRPWVDLSRVAVWGWSGGGSMTDNLMFRAPDLYKVGMSVAAVPDQELYDSIYQERYMGLPKENAAGYHDGSPSTSPKDCAGNCRSFTAPVTTTSTSGRPAPHQSPATGQS